MLAWWYAKGDTPAGPISETELARLYQSKTINLQTRVWHKGMTAWVPIAALTELRCIFEGSVRPPVHMPPPPPPPPMPPVTVPQPVRTQTEDDAPPGWILPVAAVIVFITVITVGIAAWQHHRMMAATTSCAITASCRHMVWTIGTFRLSSESALEQLRVDLRHSFI